MNNNYRAANSVATALKGLSIIIYIIGAVGGIVLCDKVINTIAIFVLITTWISTAILGTLLLGIAEIISLLETIKNQTYGVVTKVGKTDFGTIMEDELPDL